MVDVYWIFTWVDTGHQHWLLVKSTALKAYCQQVRCHAAENWPHEIIPYMIKHAFVIKGMCHLRWYSNQRHIGYVRNYPLQNDHIINFIYHTVRVMTHLAHVIVIFNIIVNYGTRMHIYSNSTVCEENRNSSEEYRYTIYHFYHIYISVRCFLTFQKS